MRDGRDRPSQISCTTRFGIILKCRTFAVATAYPNSSGASFEEILADYPSFEREDILAAVDYAAHPSDHTVLQTS